MTTTEFKINMKKALDQVDEGGEVFITRGGKIYTVKKLA